MREIKKEKKRIDVVKRAAAQLDRDLTCSEWAICIRTMALCGLMLFNVHVRRTNLTEKLKRTKLTPVVGADNKRIESVWRKWRSRRWISGIQASTSWFKLLRRAYRVVTTHHGHIADEALNIWEHQIHVNQMNVQMNT